MKQIALLSLCLIVVAIAGTSALLAIQNVDPVSITLLSFQSIQIPFGLTLTACAALGAITTALSLVLSRGYARQR
ncbi:MAG: DUF1049 domain-containing protein [Coleofasciculaceae cyanobacterium RL_1_1]|nr:DUF1049 domain-containing protein [Coleofasciculaceae cyanobacterium RL_1_1]